VGLITFDGIAQQYLQEKNSGNRRIPRSVYGKMIYQYCKEKGIRWFSARKVKFHPELAKLLTLGQIRQAFVYLNEKGMVIKNGDGWRMLI